MPEDFVVDFAEIESVAGLGLAIGCSPALIQDVIELNDAGGPKPMFVLEEVEGKPIPPVVVRDPGLLSPYFKRYLPKKNARRRTEGRLVWVVADVELANAQKALARRLDLYLRRRLQNFPSGCVHGYVRERSTVTNARPHVGARLLLNGDIRDFFPTITSDRLSKALLAAGMTLAGADTLARFATIGGALPLGLNASPLLANLVCIGLDERMLTLARGHSCAYTRYADDFTMSGNRSLPTREEIAAVLETEGFALAEEKFRTSKRGQKHFVTGLGVSDANAPRLPKALKRRLRQELYYCEKFGLDGHFDRNRRRSSLTKLDGRIAYALGVEPKIGALFAQKWRAIRAREGQWVFYPPRPERAPHKLFMLFDESAVQTSGGSVFSMCCVVLDDPNGIRAQLQTLLKRYVADPFASGRKDTLKRRGFHYTDDAEEIRTDVIKLMTELPLRAFISYGVRPRGATYQDAYGRSFSTLVRDRLFAADRRLVELIYEENPEVRHASLNAALEKLYAAMNGLETRRPLEQPRLTRASKLAEPLLALPDYFLGVFGAFALSESRHEKRELATKRFERLRDRFRLIVALNHDIWFSRHRPFVPWPGGDPLVIGEGRTG